MRQATSSREIERGEKLVAVSSPKLSRTMSTCGRPFQRRAPTAGRAPCHKHEIALSVPIAWSHGRSFLSAEDDMADTG